MGTILFILLILIVLVFAGMCSGLNIAILSLDLSHLKRQSRIGNRRATKVLKYKENVHLSLVSILIINIAFISAISIILNSKLSSWLSLIIATLLTVIFAEIIPQAMFNNNPLKFIYFLRWFLDFSRILTYPISKPLEYFLNRAFPQKMNSLTSRNELGLIISEHLNNKGSDLDEDEVEIMRGALELSNKDVIEIMTPIENTFSITVEDKLDQKLIGLLKKEGYSRIPVFDKYHKECIGLLILKNIFDLDFDDHILKIADLNLYPAKSVNYNMALDTLFRKFINSKTHMLMVVKNSKIIGIVTIEDLLEEIINHEIEDENDYYKKLRSSNE